ncbi:DUF7260 family protein [Haloarcula litorea]|uniref:DUF7260 family protein n=1 Tax=Haloarcula litorea TaxID=3032579 RepID=UPI0023E8F68B|nr:hypothetical protein [Halomicroarcula sp. GDY20]
MATATTESGAFLHSLREYVLGPVRTAAGLVASERDEIAAELAAFEALADRIADIEPTDSVPATSDQMCASPSADDPRWTRVRAAYRETAMSVDHYEELYDEPLVQNASAELGPELARAMQPDSGVRFTPRVKELLTASVEQCIDQRGSLHSFVEREHESLRTCRDDLTEVVECLDGTTVPNWYVDTFRADLDEISARRQRHLQSASRVDSHDFYAHLFDEQPWTYPVLTTVTRLEDAVLDDRERGPA